MRLKNLNCSTHLIKENIVYFMHVTNSVICANLKSFFGGWGEG